MGAQQVIEQPLPHEALQRGRDDMELSGHRGEGLATEGERVDIVEGRHRGRTRRRGDEGHLANQRALVEHREGLFGARGVGAGHAHPPPREHVEGIARLALPQENPIAGHASELHRGHHAREGRGRQLGQERHGRDVGRPLGQPVAGGDQPRRGEGELGVVEGGGIGLPRHLRVGLREARAGRAPQGRGARGVAGREGVEELVGVGVEVAEHLHGHRGLQGKPHLRGLDGDGGVALHREVEAPPGQQHVGDAHAGVEVVRGRPHEGHQGLQGAAGVPRSKVLLGLAQQTLPGVLSHPPSRPCIVREVARGQRRITWSTQCRAPPSISVSASAVSLCGLSRGSG